MTNVQTIHIRKRRKGTTHQRAACTTRTEPFSPLGAAIKRCGDIFLATFLLLALAPITIIAALAIKVGSPGPVLFRQERVGRDRRRFTMYKLRTMTTGNDDAEHRAYVAALIRGDAPRHDGTFKLTGDRRVTREGRILRRLSIDEIPQLWNVVTGSMSIIGPRPPLPHEVALYNERTLLRLRVRPGLTGLWQVNGRCNLTFDEMVELDIAYWQQWSLRRDLVILLRTPGVVLGGKGAA